MKKAWTKEEDSLLIKLYSIYGPDCYKQFTGRTRAGVYNHAQQLGLIYRQEMQGWSDEELEILKAYYPIEGKKVIERLPGRTVNTIQVKAHRLGIKKNF